jgi:hypothetical protein
MILIHRTCGKKFVNYASSSFAACHGPPACRGIWKKRCPAFEVLNPGWLPGDSAASDEVFLGKPEFEVFLPVGSQMF